MINGCPVEDIPLDDLQTIVGMGRPRSPDERGHLVPALERLLDQFQTDSAVRSDDQ